DPQTAPIKTPFSLTASQRGVTRGRISNAIQAGKRVTVTWDGGQPLPFSANGGGLDLAGARLEADPGGLTWALDGDAHLLLPAHYTVTATVAIGTGRGLATPHEG